MATSDEIVEVRIVYDSKPARREMDKLAKATKKSSKEGKKSLDGLSKAVAGLAAAFSAVKVAQFAGKLSKLAATADEVQSKFDAVLKGQKALGEAFVEDLAESVGRSRVELKEFVAGLQDTFVPLGFARDEALKLSTGLTKLAIDVASFNNKADKDVIRDFQSALVGNTETVRKYGIVITETRLKQEAFNQGLDPKKLTEQQKAQLRYQMILEGTTDAQGDATRTANSFANQMKRASSQTSELGAELGRALNQSLRPTLAVYTEMVPTLTEVAKGFARAREESSKAISAGRAQAGAVDTVAQGLAEMANVTAVALQSAAADVITVGAAFAGYEDIARGAQKTSMDLVRGYKSVGDAMKDLKREARAAAAAQKELIEQQQKAAQEAKRLDAVMQPWEDLYSTLERVSKVGDEAIKALIPTEELSEAEKHYDAIDSSITELANKLDTVLRPAFLEANEALKAGDTGSGASYYAEEILKMEEQIERLKGIRSALAREVEEEQQQPQREERAELMEQLQEDLLTEEEIRQQFHDKVRNMAWETAEQEKMAREWLAEEQRKIEDQRNALQMQQLQSGARDTLSALSRAFGAYANESKKAFELMKAVNIAQTVMNTASAVIQSYNNAGGYPWGLVPAAAMAAAGAAQIGAISKQKFGSTSGGVAPANAGGGGGGGGPNTGGPGDNQATPQLRQTVNLSVQGTADEAAFGQSVVSALNSALNDGAVIDQVNFQQ